MSEATGPRWRRRNWWGLAAVVPLLGGVLLISPDDSFQILRNEHTEEVLHPGAGGWVSYGDVRLRLTGFGPADLRDDEGQPFAVPGLTAWRATITIETGADPNVLLGCDLELEDTAGRRYLDGPASLTSANDADGQPLYSADCAQPYEQEEAGQTGPFDAVGYFMLPESEEPVALRVSHYTQERAYVRIDVG